MRHIPNVLSALRLLMVGVFIYFFVNAQYLACTVTYAVAFLTDLLDGYLARRNNWISDVGKVLDPLADKAMLLSAVLCFYCEGWIPFYMLAIIFGKEIVMILGGLILFRKNIVVYSDWFGKSAAGVFTASVFVTLARNFIPELGSWHLVLFIIAMVLAVIALIHYAKLQVFNKRIKPAEDDKKA